MSLGCVRWQQLIPAWFLAMVFAAFAAVIGFAQDSKPLGEVSIVINTNSRTLTLYANGEEFKRFPVAVGKPSTPSPVGEWKIVSKSRDWGGGFGTRWLGLNVPWGIYGIHGTNKPHLIGGEVSAGCFRMMNDHVEQLFDWVNIGVRVTVTGPVEIPSGQWHRGMSGQKVVYLQLALRKAGFDAGPADGRFGPLTAEAVSSLRRFYGLPENEGVVDTDVYHLLGVHCH